MRLAVIGGLDRSGPALERAARRSGHEFEFHSGQTAGRGSDEIRAIVARAEVVFVLTDVNSHNAVLLARREGQRLGRQVVLVRRLGLRSLIHRLQDGCELPALPLAS
jgi:hypothetical protein